MIRVLIADDQEMARTGFRLILSRESDIEVIGDAANGQEAVDIALREHPDVVLMDIRMPIMDGLAASARLAADRNCASRVLILTTFDDDAHVFNALAAGASGFLLKDATTDELIAAIRVVAAGQALLAPTVTRRLISQFAQYYPRSHDVNLVATLTGREREVLQAMSQGMSNSEIAKALTVGDATVKTHVARILQKLQARDRAQAVIVAYRSGLAYERNAQ